MWLDSRRFPELQREFGRPASLADGNLVPEAVPLERTRWPVVPVSIEGRGPYRFLVETGQTGYTLSEHVMDELGLAVDEAGRAVTSTLRIGNLEWQGIVFGVTEASRVIQLSGRKFDGVLGNLFWIVQDCVPTIDYAEHTLYIEPAALRAVGAASHGRACSMAGMEIRNSYPLLPVRVQGRGPYRFLLDTGSSKCVVSPKIAAELDLPKGDIYHARSPSGPRLCTKTCLAAMDVASAQATDVEADIMDCAIASKLVEGEVDGYVCTNYLRRFAITLDYPNRTAILWRRLPDG